MGEETDKKEEKKKMREIDGISYAVCPMCESIDYVFDGYCVNCGVRV